MNTLIDNFLEKQIVSDELIRNNYSQALDESSEAIAAISGVGQEVFDEFKNSICKKSIEELKTLTYDQVLEIVPEKIINNLNKQLAHATEVRRRSFIKDYVVLIKEQDELSKGMDRELDSIRKDNEEFKEKMDSAIKEIMDSKQTLRESLEETINNPEASEIDKDPAQQMLKAMGDVENLSFLNNKNLKNLVKTINNPKEFDRVKTKAMKLINKYNYGMPLPYNFFENELKKIIVAIPEMKEVDNSIKTKLVLIISIRFFMFISKTKRLDVYEKSYILYFKTFLIACGENKELKSLDVAKFKENIVDYMKFVSDKRKIIK